MPKGWRGDSARHSLAAKGMKTSKSRRVPHKSAKLDETAFMVGTVLQNTSEEYKNYIIFRDNLKGLVTDWEVPHSELAIHSGAAGGDIVAIVGKMTNGNLRYATVAYKKGDKYGYVSGLPNEVMSPETANVVERFYGGK
jgi:hypothetical protein